MKLITAILILLTTSLCIAQKQMDEPTSYKEDLSINWSAYQIKDYNVDVDFRSVYGDAFEILTNSKPKSVMLMEGSKVSVERKKLIKA